MCEPEDAPTAGPLSACLPVCLPADAFPGPKRSSHPCVFCLLQPAAGMGPSAAPPQRLPPLRRADCQVGWKCWLPPPVLSACLVSTVCMLLAFVRAYWQRAAAPRMRWPLALLGDAVAVLKRSRPQCWAKVWQTAPLTSHRHRERALSVCLSVSLSHDTDC